MDDKFKDLLTQEQIEQCTIKVLEEECIYSDCRNVQLAKNATPGQIVTED